MDWHTLQGYIDQQRSDDFFRSIGFPRGRQDAMDYVAKQRESDPSTIMQRAIDKYNTAIDDYNKKYKEFDDKNPFSFDKVLAEERTKAKQRLDPYYEQTLSDYLTSVNTRRTRSLDDERTLLTDLQTDTDRLIGDQKVQAEDAISRSREGYADAGIYDSGARLRAEGRIQADTNQTTQNALQNQDRQARNISTQATRMRSDLATEETQKRQNLATEEAYNVESQALPAVTQRQQQREFERGQYTGPAPGVNPLQFQNSLYTLIQ